MSPHFDDHVYPHVADAPSTPHCKDTPLHARPQASEIARPLHGWQGVARYLPPIRGARTIRRPPPLVPPHSRTPVPADRTSTLACSRGNLDRGCVESQFVSTSAGPAATVPAYLLCCFCPVLHQFRAGGRGKRSEEDNVCVPSASHGSMSVCQPCQPSSGVKTLPR